MRSIRKLTVFDANAVREHFARLDPESRHLRFMGGISDVALAQYARTTPSLGHHGVACFEGRALRALGELVMPHWPSARDAEIALSVEDAYQGQGIGAELMDRLLTIAVNRGVRRVKVSCLIENVRMRRIVEKFNGTMMGVGGVIEAEIATGMPSYWSLLSEGIQNARGVARGLVDRAA